MRAIPHGEEGALHRGEGLWFSAGGESGEENWEGMCQEAHGALGGMTDDKRLLISEPSCRD